MARPVTSEDSEQPQDGASASAAGDKPVTEVGPGSTGELRRPADVRAAQVRDERVLEATSASGTRPQPAASVPARGGSRQALLRVVAVVAALVLVVCGYAAASYASGSDPLAFLGADALRTVEQPEAASGEKTLAADEEPVDEAVSDEADEAALDEEDAVAGEDQTADEGSSATADEQGSSSAAGTTAGGATGSGSAGSGSSGTGGSAGSGSVAGSGAGSGAEAGTSSGSGSGSGAGSGGSSGGGGSSTPQPAPKPQIITVSITVDASAAGGGSSSATVELAPGASVYDALLAAGVSVSASETQFGLYVTNIGGYGAGELGAESGWKYAVNGSVPAMSCSSYTLSDGDTIRWYYVLHAND